MIIQRIPMNPFEAILAAYLIGSITACVFTYYGKLMQEKNYSKRNQHDLQK